MNESGDLPEFIHTSVMALRLGRNCLRPSRTPRSSCSPRALCVAGSWGMEGWRKTRFWRHAFGIVLTPEMKVVNQATGSVP